MYECLVVRIVKVVYIYLVEGICCVLLKGIDDYVSYYFLELNGVFFCGILGVLMEIVFC